MLPQQPTQSDAVETGHGDTRNQQIRLGRRCRSKRLESVGGLRDSHRDIQRLRDLIHDPGDFAAYLGIVIDHEHQYPR